MSFIHDDPEFATLLQLVADETRIGPSLVEKDYWVTHCMWALHYEDAAQIIRSLPTLPPASLSPRALADEMLSEKDLVAIPSPDEPALTLTDAARRAAVERALARIQTMFWGPRIPVDEACATIREWVRENLG